MRARRDLWSRIERRLRRSAARARHRLGLPEPRIGAVTLATAFRHPVDANQKRALATRYRQLFPEAVVQELAEAQRLMHHEFTLLGQSVAHGERIAWFRDPVSGADWSPGFSADIPYRGAARLGDIKFPWELNKHQYFFTLGKAAWLTEDPSFAIEIVRQIDRWMDENPCLRGINWISALEVGTRAISWIMAYPFYASQCDADFRHRLGESLARHMRFIEKNLSTGPFANTHLVGEAAALVAGGLFLASRQSSRWLEKGVAILNDEIDRQVTADGVHAERSVAYHRFFLDHYYLVVGLLAANGRQLAPRTLQQMEKMTAFLMDVVFPDGSAPAFGDSDYARGLWLHAHSPEDYRSSLALGAVLFGRSDFKAVAGDLPEEILWLLGNEAVNKFQDLKEHLPDHTSAAFPDGGYYVMRGGWGRTDPVLAFDCGPLGHGPAGHGHADALSFQLHAGGYPFFVDAGTFSYNLDYEWRDVFRSTRAHNTIVVDGQDQSLRGDRMSWKSKAHARPRRWVTTRWFDLVEGEHDGYNRFADPVTHRRVAIFIKPGTWWIWDRLDAAGHHEFEAMLHLLPDCTVEPFEEGSGVRLQSPDGTRLDARAFIDGELALPDVLVGSEDERAVWFSPGYGLRVPTRALRIKRRFVGRATLVTSVSASKSPAPMIFDQERSLRVAARSETGTEDILFYRVNHEWPAETDGIRFDGQLLYRRTIPGGSGIVWATEFRELSIAGVFDARSLVPVESLELIGDRCEVTVPSQCASDFTFTITAAEPIDVVVNRRPTPVTGAGNRDKRITSWTNAT